MPELRISPPILLRLAVVAVAVAAVATPAPGAGAAAPAVETHLAAYAGAAHADGPGVAFLAARHGQILSQGFYGLADRARHAPAFAATRWNLASNSKQFTAAAVLMLEERGALVLADPVAKYLPDWPAYARDVTIRQLLFHTGGLPDYMPLCQPGQAVDNAAVLRFLASQNALRFRPGTQYEYSDSGYVVLAALVQRLAKRPFDRVLAEEMFKPLGMTSALVLTRAVAGKVPHAALAFDGATTVDGIDIDSCDYVVGDGGVLTTIADYGRWLAAVAGGKLPFLKDPRRLLDRGAKNDGTPLGYGFGWQVSSFAGARMVAHSGLWGGAKSFAALFPDDGLVVAVLANDARVPVWEAATDLARRFLRPKK